MNEKLTLFLFVLRVSSRIRTGLPGEFYVTSLDTEISIVIFYFCVPIQILSFILAVHIYFVNFKVNESRKYIQIINLFKH